MCDLRTAAHAKPSSWRSRHGAVTHVARQLGIGAESLRQWVHQAEIDRGQRAGLTREECKRLKALERDNREPRRGTGDYAPAVAARTFSVSPPTSSQIFTCLLSRMNRPPMITVITAITIG